MQKWKELSIFQAFNFKLGHLSWYKSPRNYFSTTGANDNYLRIVVSVDDEVDVIWGLMELVTEILFAVCLSS